MDFSLTKTQVRIVKMMKITATIKANHLKPTSSTSPSAAPNILPSTGTIFMVRMVMIALPTPAQERASVVSPSRSLPPSVNAGIIDQYGMSIIV